MSLDYKPLTKTEQQVIVDLTEALAGERLRIAAVEACIYPVASAINKAMTPRQHALAGLFKHLNAAQTRALLKLNKETPA